MTISVLFVDDEENFLEGLRRSFGKYRNEWRMSFATSSEEALEKLEETRMDYIFCDQMMPGCSGSDLLDIVSKRWPGTIRVALSGEARPLIALDLANKAHYTLSKPCPTDTLANYIKRSAKYSDMFNSDLVRTSIAGITAPLLPYKRLSKFADSGLQDDLVSAAHMLRLTVSYFLERERRSTEVPDDYLRLMGQSMKKTAMARKDLDYPNAVVDRLWEEVLEIAPRAAAMAKAAGLSEAQQNDTFISASFCNIGSIALADRFPDIYQNAVGDVETPERWQNEQQCFGVSGLTVNAYLMALWGFSDHVVKEVMDQNVTLDSMAGHDTEARILSSARDRDWPMPVEIEKEIGQEAELASA